MLDLVYKAIFKVASHVTTFKVVTGGVRYVLKKIKTSTVTSGGTKNFHSYIWW